MCSCTRCVVCPMSGGLLSKFVGCVFQWEVLACVNRSFKVRMGVERWSNVSYIILLGSMYWIMRVSLCAPEPHRGASKVMMGVKYSCVWGCSSTLGELASMYPIPVGCVLSRK